MLAQLINKINASNPSAIGIDILLPEKDRTSPLEIENFYQKYFGLDVQIQGLNRKYFNNDLILAEAIKNSQSVLSYYLSENNFTHNKCANIFSLQNRMKNLNLNEYSFLMCNSDVIQDSSSKQGFVNKHEDNNGILRQTPLFARYKDKVLPSFALATLLSIQDDILYDKTKFKVLNHTIKMANDSNVLLNYYAHEWYKKISAVDLLKMDGISSFIKSKVVFIGSSSVALHDRVITPNGREMSGVQINATVVGNILDDSLIYQPSENKFRNFMLSFLLSILLIIILLKKSRIWIVVLFIFVLMSSMLYNLISLSNGIYISLGFLIIPFLVHFFIINLLSIVIDVLEKKLFAEELNQSQIALFDSMVHVAEAHDVETGEHIVRTKKYVRLLAKSIRERGFHKDYLSMVKIEIMYQTSALHDIGKVGITDLILKKKGKLTLQEFKIMKTHSRLGRNIIDNAISSYKENEFFTTARNITYYHHEKYDGSGYPEGLVGSDIPLEARIMALADVYDALMSKRVYKESFSYEKTKQIILEGRYKHFDPIVVDAFLDKEEEFISISQSNTDK